MNTELSDALHAHNLFVSACISEIPNELGKQIGSVAGLDFVGANLRWCCLRFANLSGRDFRGIDAAKVDFADSNLSNADFTGANLRGANFAGADLRGAKFTDADLAAANFRGAVFR